MARTTHPLPRWRGAVLPAVLAGALLSGCGGDDRDSTADPTAQSKATTGTSSATPTGGPAVPVIKSNFPDPDVMAVGATYYAFATEHPGGSNVQAMKSTDLKTWTELPDAFPTLPAWANEGRTWAPEVYQRGDKKFVLYFTAWHTASERQCIGVAVSSKPAGPFTATSDEPFICPLSQGGAIDAASYAEGGKRYILWKNDGNCCGKDTWLYLQQVDATGTKLLGKATRLIKQDKDFEGNLVEAPTLWKHGSRYYLFYSANDYSGAKYMSSYATATSITGPYKKADEPLMTTEKFGDDEVIGPGGQDVFIGPDKLPRIAFHGWDGGLILRAVYVRPLTFAGDKPVVAGVQTD
jgi:beta-xylosidase